MRESRIRNKVLILGSGGLKIGQASVLHYSSLCPSNTVKLFDTFIPSLS